MMTAAPVNASMMMAVLSRRTVLTVQTNIILKAVLVVPWLVLVVWIVVRGFIMVVIVSQRMLTQDWFICQPIILL